MTELSPSFYQHLAQNASIGLHVVDKNGVLLYVNEFFAKMLGYSADEMIGKPALDFVHEKDRNYLSRSMSFLFQKKNKPNAFAETETCLVCADGEPIIVESRTINLSNALQKTTLFSITRDITAEKQAQEFLQNEQNQLQTILDNTKYSFFLINKDNAILYFNRSAKKFHTIFYKDTTLKIGDKVTQYKAFQKKPELLEQYIKSAFEEGKTISYEQILQKPPHNDTAWAQVTIHPVNHPNQPPHAVAISLIDTSARKRAELQLLENQSLLEAIFNNALHGIFLLDKDYKILMFNERGKKDAKENWQKIPKIEESFLDYVSPKEKDNFLIRMEKCFARNESKHIETEITVGKNDNERKIWYEIYYSPITNPQGDACMLVVSFLNVDARKKGEFAVLAQNDLLKRKEEELLELNKSLTEKRANLLSLNKELMLKNQVLAQQEEELKAINENLRTKQEETNHTLAELSDRNFELDQLIYRTSHDIRSPLTSILGLVNVMRYEEIPEHLLIYIDKIEQSIKKLDNFTNSMLNFGKNQRVERKTEPINFEAIIQKCWDDFQYMPNFQRLDKKIHIDSDGSEFSSDIFRMEIVFANIISNAIKYQNTSVEHSFLDIFIEIKNQKATIQFNDNGIGIKKEYLNKIFDMFFRATDASEGSGLGLYIVKQTIEKLGGAIKIESEYKKGTKFMIVF